MSQAAVAYRQVGARSTVLGAVDSLENIVSSPLPDGAECWVIENASVYRLDKASTVAPAGAQIVAPIAGGGRWYRLAVSPIQIQSVSAPYGFISTNTSTTPGTRLVPVVFLDIPSGSSVIAYGTFSGQPPTVAGGILQITYQSSANTTLQVMPRSGFLEDTATRRSFAASGFLGPFATALSWLHVRLNFQSLVATAVTVQFPPDQASLTVMVVPPLTKV